MDQSPNASRKSNALGRVGGWSNENAHVRRALLRLAARPAPFTDAERRPVRVLAGPRERSAADRLRRRLS